MHRPQAGRPTWPMTVQVTCHHRVEPFVDSPARRNYSARSMNSEMATKVRISGLVRSPDREGALAHFDPERGFVLVARSSMGVADVIDPTIWVKEKISLALAVPGEGEPPLRRV